MIARESRRPSPRRRRALLDRLGRLRARDLRTIALAVAAILLLSYAGVSTLSGGSGTALPGQGTSLQELIFGEQPLKREDGYPRLEISRLGIDLAIANGDGRTPPPQAKAWVYPGTAWPGSNGNSYVYAHSRKGAFKPLHDVKLGDQVLLDFGGGRTSKFVVTELHPSVKYDDFHWVSFTSPTPRLTLQTCDGFRDTDPRFIVVASQI